MEGHDPSRGWRTDVVAVRSPKLRWSTPLVRPGVVEVEAVGADGTVYVQTMWRETSVWALAAADGSVRWRQSFAFGAVEVAVAPNGRVLVARVDSLVGLDASTGEIAWRTQLQACKAFDVGYGGAAYVVDNHELRAYSSDSGALAWTFPLGTEASIAIASDDTLVVATAGGDVVIVEPDGGERARAHTGNYCLDVAVTRDNLAIACNRVVRLDGEILGELHDMGRVLSLAADGTQYCQGIEGVLNEPLSARTIDDQLLWVTGTSDHVSPVVDGAGSLIFASDSRLYALSGADASVEWTWDAPGPLAHQLAIGADGTLYVGGADGTAYALGP
jgi:outer membrane protein assembly factor BamB